MPRRGGACATCATSRRCSRAIAEAAEALGDFAVLVNNVASDDRHTLESVTPAYYDERMAINERPAFFAIQSVVPGMRRLGFGSIVNLGSTGWQGKGGGYPCYAIAKSSVNGLTRGLAQPLGQDRIRINTVSPGWVMTERQIKLWLDAEGEAELKRNQCLPDKLQPHDIARMVLFLASDDAAMCTAQEFKVDAGWSLRPAACSALRRLSCAFQLAPVHRRGAGGLQRLSSSPWPPATAAGRCA